MALNLPPDMSNSANINLMIGDELVLSFYVDKIKYLDFYELYCKNPKMVVKSSDSVSTTFDYLVDNNVEKTQTIYNNTDMGKMLIAAYSSDPRFVVVS